jgi:hypothetical protein
VTSRDAYHKDRSGPPGLALEACERCLILGTRTITVDTSPIRLRSGQALTPHEERRNRFVSSVIEQPTTPSLFRPRPEPGRMARGEVVPQI